LSADGRSPFTTAMLALDCLLVIEPDSEMVGLGEILPLRPNVLNHRLVTSISVPKNAALAYEYVARSPTDLPIVCVAAALWPSGRTRIALGGYGAAPILVFDGNDAEGADLAAGNAYSLAGDQWASADYRQEIASVLTNRAVGALLKKE
jgi:CO/xanthine dehydrogenase FAD-binding subunit